MSSKPRPEASLIKAEDCIPRKWVGERRFNRLVENKYQAVSQGVQHFGKRSLFGHMPAWTHPPVERGGFTGSHKARTPKALSVCVTGCISTRADDVPSKSNLHRVTRGGFQLQAFVRLAKNLCRPIEDIVLLDFFPHPGHALPPLLGRHPIRLV